MSYPIPKYFKTLNPNTTTAGKEIKIWAKISFILFFILVEVWKPEKLSIQLHFQI